MLQTAPHLFSPLASCRQTIGLKISQSSNDVRRSLRLVRWPERSRYKAVGLMVPVAPCRKPGPLNETWENEHQWLTHRQASGSLTAPNAVCAALTGVAPKNPSARLVSWQGRLRPITFGMRNKKWLSIHWPRPYGSWPCPNRRPGHLVHPGEPDIHEPRLCHHSSYRLLGPIMGDARQHVVEYDRSQVCEIEFPDKPEIFDRANAKSHQQPNQNGRVQWQVMCNADRQSTE